MKMRYFVHFRLPARRKQIYRLKFIEQLQICLPDAYCIPRDFGVNANICYIAGTINFGAQAKDSSKRFSLK